jgi:hypothetical protein
LLCNIALAGSGWFALFLTLLNLFEIMKKKIIKVSTSILFVGTLTIAYFVNPADAYADPARSTNPSGTFYCCGEPTNCSGAVDPCPAM